MVKVVIADDENIVRLGMASLIDWRMLGYEITGMFADGCETFAFCRANPPDIVITDIEMPSVDGIELIALLREHLPSVRVLVLSNHDKFQYVSTSYKHGVTDYLLKQFLEPAQLLEALEHIRATIDVPAEVPNRTRGNGGAAIYGAFLCEGGEEAAGQLIRSMERENPTAQLCVAQIHIHADTCPEPELLCTVMENALAKYAQVRAAGMGADLYLLAVGELDGGKLADLFVDVHEQLFSLFALRCAIGHSGVVSVGELRRARQNAARALRFALFVGAHELTLDASGLKEDVALNGSFLQFIAESGERIRRCEFDSLNDRLRGLIGALDVDHYVPVTSIRRGIDGLIYQLIAFLSDQNDAGIQQLLASHTNFFMLQEGERLESADKLMEYADRALSEAKRLVIGQTQRQSHIARVRAYVDEHYAEDLSLESVARVFHLSSKYLSQEFKRKAGINFSQHINAVRIQAALKLLLTTNLSTEEISERCGFSSANYFVRVLKRVTGKTVSQYRNW